MWYDYVEPFSVPELNVLPPEESDKSGDTPPPKMARKGKGPDKVIPKSNDKSKKDKGKSNINKFRSRSQGQCSQHAFKCRSQLDLWI